MQLQYITATNTNTTRTTLHYTTLRYTNCIALHYSCNYHYIPLHDTKLQLQLRYFTIHLATLHYTALQYTTLQYTTLITPHHNYNCNCNYATLITPHYSYNLQLRLHNTTTTTTRTTTTTTSLHHTIWSSWGGFLFLKLPPPLCGTTDNLKTPQSCLQEF